MSEPTVVAIDPGKMTGWASLSGGVVKLGQSPWFEAACWLEDIVRVSVRDKLGLILVSESFTVTAATVSKSREYDAFHLIGLARYLAQRYLTHELILQSPGDAKSFVDDDKLRTLGWYVKGQDHARDAARHLTLYLVREKLLDPRALVT